MRLAVVLHLILVHLVHFLVQVVVLFRVIIVLDQHLKVADLVLLLLAQHLPQVVGAAVFSAVAAAVPASTRGAAAAARPL